LTPRVIREATELDLLRPDWMQYAACRKMGFNAWFPADESGDGSDAARRICTGCGVRTHCLEYALAAGIGHGLWGGLSSKERAAVTRRRR
jgi:WhiB family redox-sensing transcriptional regulator